MLQNVKELTGQTAERKKEREIEASVTVCDNVRDIATARICTSSTIDELDPKIKADVEEAKRKMGFREVIPTAPDSTSENALASDA